MIQEPVEDAPKQSIPMMDQSYEVTTKGLNLASTIIYNIETGESIGVVCADALELTSPNQIVIKAVKQYHDNGKPKMRPASFTNDPMKCKKKPELIQPFSKRQKQLIAQEHRQRLSGNNQGIDSSNGYIPPVEGGEVDKNLPNEVAELETEDLRKLCSALGMPGGKASKRRKLIKFLSDYEDREELLEEIENISPPADINPNPDDTNENPNPNPNESEQT